MTLQERVNAFPYWYHRIQLPGGVVTPGWAPISVEAYRVPADLSAAPNPFASDTAVAVPVVPEVC